MKAKYDKYVHEYTDKNGVTRYAVAEWVEDANQYQRPLSKIEREITNCHTEFAKSVREFGGYLSRTKALRRARYLFSED